MRLPIAAVFALLPASSLCAQDLATATPIAGSWTYAPAGDGSEAVFANTSGAPQLFVHCTQSTRRISISKSASAAAPSITVWTSSLQRPVAASFNPATSRLTLDFATYDPLLDAIVSSRGRVAFTVGTEPSLVVPPWGEIARVIEDCRS
jgi:hypothetical protein